MSADWSIALQTLAVDATTARLVSLFESHGVDCMLLKGPATTELLYGEGGLRAYVDIDIMVSNASRCDAEELLRKEGYTPLPMLKYDVVRHADTWKCGQGGPSVDLHRSFHGISVSEDRCWPTLWQTRSTLNVGGRQACVLDQANQTMVLALHAAAPGAAASKVRHELQVAIEVVDRDTWILAAQRARNLGADAAMAAGLSMVIGGKEFARALALNDDNYYSNEGRWSTIRPILSRAAELPLHQAVLYLLRKALPPREYLLDQYPGPPGSLSATRAQMMRYRRFLRTVSGRAERAVDD